MKKKAKKKEKTHDELIEDLRRVFSEPDTDYDLPKHVPLKEGGEIATFIKRRRSK